MWKLSGGDLLGITDEHSMDWELYYVLVDGISTVALNNDVISFAALNFFPYF